MQTRESVCVRGLLQVLEEDSRPAGALRRLWRLPLLLRLQRKAREQTVHSDAPWLLCSQRHVAHGGQGQASLRVTWMIPTPGLPNYPSKCVFLNAATVLCIHCSSTYQSIYTSCVWTCPATRGRPAPTLMTTPFTGRSEEFVRYIMFGFIDRTSGCSTEKLLVVLVVCLFVLVVWSLWRTFAWTGNHFTWWEPPWVGT